MIPSNNLFDRNRYSEHNCSDQGPILPISNSVKAGRGITMSFGNKSRGQRSNSRQRKPIFSKDTYANTTEGFNIIKHLDRTQSYQTNTFEKQLVKKISSPEQFSFKPESYNGDNQSQSINSNILNLMKQQLQISITKVQSKMSQQIKKNNDQLIRSQNKLRLTENMLVEKESQISSLRQKLDRAILGGRFGNVKDGDQFSKNFQYLTSKLRQVQIKIKVITSQNTQVSKQKQNQTLLKLQQKLQMISQVMFMQFHGKVKNLSQKVSNYETQIQQFNSQIMNLKHRKQDNQSLLSKIPEMQQKIIVFKRQFENTVRLVQSYSSKQFKYDNYEMKTLRAKIEAIIQSVTVFEGEKVKVNTYLEQIELQHKQLLTQIKHQYKQFKNQQNKEMGVEPGKIKSKKHLMETSNNVNNMFCNSMKMISTKSSDQYSMNDTFIPQEDDDSQEDFEDESKHSQQIVKRLIDTIRKTRNPIPLQCQIDETGYLKYTKSGTYVFDVDGNLFQLSKNEIKLAIHSKVIVLS